MLLSAIAESANKDKSPSGPDPKSESTQSDRNSGRLWRRFRRHTLAMVGLFLLVVIGLAALCAPVITSSKPNDVDTQNVLKAPTRNHILGTDELGRDVFARLLYGGRVSLSVGLVAVSIFLAIGVVLGGLSGFFGGAVDTVIQRLTEMVMTLPTLLIIITVVSLVGPSIYNIFLTIGLLGWTGVCRLVRAEFLSLRERDFVTSARAVGVTTLRTVFRHILPNAMAPVIVAGTLGVANAILIETGLSFLGLGVQPPTPSWGNLLSDATRISILTRNWWLWVPPGVAISLTVLSINFIGDALRDALDPREEV